MLAERNERRRHNNRCAVNYLSPCGGMGSSLASGCASALSCGDAPCSPYASRRSSDGPGHCFFKDDGNVGTAVFRAPSGVVETGVMDHSVSASLEEICRVDAPALRFPEVPESSEERWVPIKWRVGDSRARDMSCLVVGQSEDANANANRNENLTKEANKQRFLSSYPVLVMRLS